MCGYLKFKVIKNTWHVAFPGTIHIDTGSRD